MFGFRFRLILPFTTLFPANLNLLEDASCLKFDIFLAIDYLSIIIFPLTMLHLNTLRGGNLLVSYF